MRYNKQRTANIVLALVEVQ